MGFLKKSWDFDDRLCFSILLNVIEVLGRNEGDEWGGRNTKGSLPLYNGISMASKKKDLSIPGTQSRSQETVHATIG